MEVHEPEQPSDIPFIRLKGVGTQAATSIEDHLAYVKENLPRNLPWLQGLPEFHRVKGRNKKIALVAGGPSIKKYIDDIKQFRTTLVCGSSNDWAMSNGIIPTYAAICDPDPISINYYQKLDTETRYLIATCCSPKIFEHLKDQQVVKWNCHSTEAEERLKGTEFELLYSYAIGGGCTIGLRAISIALALGYNNVHMFGFDSCLSEEEHHAYEFSDKDQEQVGAIHKIKVGLGDEDPKDARVFYCAGYQLAQSEHFCEFYQHYKDIFTPTVYGDGLIAEHIRLWNEEAKRLHEKQLGEVA